MNCPPHYLPFEREYAFKTATKEEVAAHPLLEIKESQDIETEDEVIDVVVPSATISAAKADYDPSLELKDYKFPTLDLLETHGSEKIVHDAEELEANKTQIIETLKNYDILIQRIAATVGPTVTLYEIVPAPGVRISRHKKPGRRYCAQPCCAWHPHYCADSGQRHHWYRSA